MSQLPQLLTGTIEIPLRFGHLCLRCFSSANLLRFRDPDESRGKRNAGACHLDIVVVRVTATTRQPQTTATPAGPFEWNAARILLKLAVHRLVQCRPTMCILSRARMTAGFENGRWDAASSNFFQCSVERNVLTCRRTVLSSVMCLLASSSFSARMLWKCGGCGVGRIRRCEVRPFAAAAFVETCTLQPVFGRQDVV